MALFSFSGLSNEKIVELTALSNASYSAESPPLGWTTLTGATLGFTEDLGTGSYSGTTFQGSDFWFGAPAARVYQKGAEITVSFRGTDSSVDYLTYLDIVGNNNYINAFSSLLDAVAKYASNPQNTITSINVVGHSLGAAAVNILRNVSATQNGGVFDSATYFTIATPKVSSNPDILNVGFENDWVYKAIARNTPFTADDFFSTTDNIVLYDNAYSEDDWPGLVFGPSDVSAHSSIGYIDAVERITKSSFYDEMSRDSVVIVVATDAQVSDKNVSTSDHFGSNAFFVGRDQADDIAGGEQVDKVDALGGDDTIEGGAGDDVIEGGEGNDVAVFRGDGLEYDVTRNSDGSITVSHQRVSLSGLGPDDGTDILFDVEIARFGDGRELDLTVEELGGFTLLSTPTALVEASGTLLPSEWMRSGDLSYSLGLNEDGEVIRSDRLGSFLDSVYDWAAGLTETQRGVIVTDGSAFENDELLRVAYTAAEMNGLEQSILFELSGTIVEFGPATIDYLATGDDGVDDQGGWWWGDPHLITFDNVAYDFQAEGEFVLARATSGDDYELQARFVAISSAASVADALATRVGSTVVSVEIDGSDGILRVDGTETALADGAFIAVGEGSVSRDGRTITIDHGNGDVTQTTVFATFLNATPIPSSARTPGGFEGLFGNDDGTPADDFQLADGSVLTTPVPIETLYGDFAASWLVTASDRLLPGSAVVYDAPDRIVTIDSLPAGLLAEATAAVDATGINNEIIREAAILDFALTGNTDFIDAASFTDRQFNPIVDTVPVDPVSNPVIVLTSDSAVLNEEESGTAILTVSRGTAEGDLTISYNVAGTGVVPTSSDDFKDSVVSGSVLIKDGEENASFTVDVVDDNQSEGPETFVVEISLGTENADKFEVLVSSVRLVVEDDDFANTPPIAVDDSVSTDEDTEVQINVVTNDGDADGDPLEVSAFDAAGANGGLVTLSGDNIFNYDPAGAFEHLNIGETATDSFNYTVTDGKGGISTATVTVNISGLSDQPAFVEIIGGDGFAPEVLTGTDANEFIYSRAGAFDRMIGGGGADHFIFGDETSNEIFERDFIMDFEFGKDKLDFEGREFTVFASSRFTNIKIGPDGDLLTIIGTGVTEADIIASIVEDTIA